MYVSLRAGGTEGRRMEGGWREEQRDEGMEGQREGGTKGQMN